MEDVKIKLSALWVAGMLNGLMGGMLELFEPGVLEQIIAEEVGGIQITQEFLLLMAILMVIPPIMVFLSLTLKDSVNRWANIILGISFAGLSLFEIIEVLQTKPSAYYYMVISIISILFSALIVWYAYKWKA